MCLIFKDKDIMVLYAWKLWSNIKILEGLENKTAIYKPY